jgi:hypothetical protein
MKLKISLGNTKLGKIPNLNLPPIKTCVPGVPCISDCYSLKAWNQYPNVREAWQSNLDLYNKDPERYFNELLSFVAKKRPKVFRVHSAGDMPDESYWQGIRYVAAAPLQILITSCLPRGTALITGTFQRTLM